MRHITIIHHKQVLPNIHFILSSIFTYFILLYIYYHKNIKILSTLSRPSCLQSVCCFISMAFQVHLELWDFLCVTQHGFVQFLLRINNQLFFISLLSQLQELQFCGHNRRKSRFEQNSNPYLKRCLLLYRFCRRHRGL